MNTKNMSARGGSASGGKKLFGTDGIRGVVGDNLINSEIGFLIGRSMVRFCEKRNLRPRIIIGRDPRWSGEDLEQAVVRGINSLNGEAVLAGVIPTPGLAFLVKKSEANLGLMITASHNPSEYNGFKIFFSSGEKLNEAEEREIEEYILASSGADENWQNINVDHDLSAYERYLDFLSQSVSSIDLSGFKIVLDCARGATSRVAPKLFQKFCASAAVLAATPDGRNINDNCGSQFTSELSRRVIESGAHVGLAFDGDGDRLIAVAETGEVLNGDQLLYIFARFLKEKNELKNDFVVSTVMSNEGLAQKLRAEGLAHARTDVGDSRVFSGMKEFGASLGGEESGHIIFSDYHTTGDGIFSGLMLLRALKHFQKPLSALANQFVMFPKVLVNIPVKNKIPLKDLTELNTLIKKIETELAGEGRVLVRYSGTEALCRVMVEARDQAKAENYARVIAKKVKELLGG